MAGRCKEVCTLSGGQQRIARQKEIDASIAAKADFESLYDKPYDDKRKVRVAGPFTVESLSPHRVLAVDENDELIDSKIERRGRTGFRSDDPGEPQDRGRAAGAQGRQDHVFLDHALAGQVGLRRGPLPGKRHGVGNRKTRSHPHRAGVRHRLSSRSGRGRPRGWGCRLRCPGCLCVQL